MSVSRWGLRIVSKVVTPPRAVSLTPTGKHLHHYSALKTEIGPPGILVFEQKLKQTRSWFFWAARFAGGACMGPLPPGALPPVRRTLPARLAGTP